MNSSQSLDSSGSQSQMTEISSIDIKISPQAHPFSQVKSQISYWRVMKIIGGCMLVLLISTISYLYGQGTSCLSSDDHKKRKDREEVVGFGFGEVIWVCTDSTEIKKSQEYALKENHAHFANISGHRVITVTDDNFQQFLPPYQLTMLQLLRQVLYHYAKNQIGDRVNEQLFVQRLRVLWRRVVNLHILAEHGGIMLQDTYALVEDLSWLERIDSNPYVNRLDRSYGTQVIGFYDPRSSSDRIRYETDEQVNSPFKLIRPSISLLPGFLAAKKGGRFIIELCIQLTKAETLLPYFIDINTELSQFKQFKDASRRVIHRYQGPKKLAIDQLGLSLINMYYGPQKVNFQLQILVSGILGHWADLSMDQFKQLMGPVNYTLQLGPTGWIAYNDLSGVFSGKRKIMRGSLLHYLLPTLKNESLYDNLEMSVANSSAPLWESLPKIVWSVWLTGYESAPVSNKVAFTIMKRRFESKGFTVNLVTSANAEQFVGKETLSELKRINENNETYQRYTPTMSDLLRLQLLDQHGGVYMDMTTYLYDEVDWILNIGRLPSHLFLNRFEQLPKVMMFFSKYINDPPFWSINPKTRSKDQWLEKYESSFFIAEKGSEFIRDIKMKHRQYLESDEELVWKEMEESGVVHIPAIIKGNTYLMIIQAIMCVMGQKQQELKKSENQEWINAAHYYGLWLFNGAYGPFKYFNLASNFEENEGVFLNTFTLQYSQEYVEGLLGKPMIPFQKMVGVGNHELMDRYMQFSQQNSSVSSVLHPRSLMKKLMDEFGLGINKVGDSLVMTESSQS